MSSNPLRLTTRLTMRMFAVIVLILTSSASMSVASPVAASTDEGTPADDVDCSPMTADEDAWEDLGLVGRRDYEGPIFGVTADWDRPWDVDVESEYPITSNEECEYDELRLAWEDGDLFGWLVLNFSIPTDVETMDDLTDKWNSAKFLTSNWDEKYTATVVASNADDTVADAVFLLVNDEDDVQFYVVFRTIALSDDTWLYVTYTSDEASLESALTALDEGVRVDGEAIPSALTWRQIERGM